MTTRYTVEVLRSGQPRAYADTEALYLIKVEHQTPLDQELRPGFPGGNLDELIAATEEAIRKGKRPVGGWTEDDRNLRREWAVALVRALCQNFRERSDNDGRTGVDAHFYPTLQRLSIDESTGTIEALIITPYDD